MTLAILKYLFLKMRDHFLTIFLYSKSSPEVLISLMEVYKAEICNGGENFERFL